MPTPYNNPYIPGDPYSYDLKWIIANIKTLSAKYENMDAIINAAVENYIDNLNIPTDYIDVTYPRHGLTPVVGDGVTDDTNALKDIISYCQLNNKPLYVPEFCKIFITDDVKFIDMPNVIMQGTIKGDPALMVWFAMNSVLVTPVTWDIGNIDGPILRIMGIKNATVRVQKATELELYADGSQTKYASMAYNNFLLGNITKLEFTDVSSGWINENVFIGGRVATFIMDGTYSHNNNIFYKLCIENTNFSIVRGHNNYFYNARLEGTNTIHFYENAIGNTIEKSWLNYSPTTAIPGVTYTDDNGSNIVIMSTAANNDYYHLFIDRNCTGFDGKYYHKTPDGMTSATTGGTIAATPIIPVTKGAYFRLESDSALWRIQFEVYDENKQRITTEPAVSPFFHGTVTWNSGQQRYVVSSNQASFARGIARYFQGSDSGVAYVKITVSAGTANTPFDHLALLVTSPKVVYDFTGFKLTYNQNCKNSAPNYYGELGDVVMNMTPASGSPMGWICTTAGDPGTWTDMPNL